MKLKYINLMWVCPNSESSVPWHRNASTHSLEQITKSCVCVGCKWQVVVLFLWCCPQTTFKRGLPLELWDVPASPSHFEGTILIYPTSCLFTSPSADMGLYGPPTRAQPAESFRVSAQRNRALRGQGSSGAGIPEARKEPLRKLR